MGDSLARPVHLKTLSLAGFKSFADRVRLSFEPGVTAVVGPNGSGKSNIVDAIAWVMGTQATSALRTERMEDVIFAGTATRPALGRTEVTLVLDNGDGRLPLDLSEVSVTRRLYRDGTSGYEINGAQCRLLDVQEMLSDGGIGRHQHVIVGQGRVDEVLNASPDEHRAVIEEAAGVIKYRRRRDRAVRRLESTDGDLLRLQDLLADQQRRMRPLKRQAAAFERHADAKEEWRAVRLWIGGEQLRRCRARLAEIEVRQATLAEGLERAAAEMARLTSSIPRLRAAAGETGRALERDTTAAARLETAAERLHRIALVAKERHGSISNLAEGAGERRRDLEVERSHLSSRIDVTVEEEALAVAAVDRHEIHVAGLEDEERSLGAEEGLAPEGAAASVRGDVAALDAAARRDQHEADAITTRLEVVRQRVAAEEEEADRLRDEIRSIDEDEGPAAAALNQAAEVAEAARDALETGRQRLAEARVGHAAAAARLEAMEGAADDRGEALEIAGGLVEVLGTVVDLLDVPPGLGPALDAALGAWSNAVAADDGAGVERIVSAVKGAGAGGLGVAASTGNQAAPARKAAAELGVDALIDLLGLGADWSLASTLIGDVLIMEGWSAAWAVVQRHPDLRVVTPEGDLITRHGIWTGSSDAGGAAALAEARHTVDLAATRIARASSLVTTTERIAADSGRAELEARSRLEAVEARLGGAGEALRLVERTRTEGIAEAGRLSTRLSSLVEGATSRDERLAALRSRLADLEGPEAERQAAWEAAASRRGAVATRRESARRSLQEASVALASVSERRRLLEARLVAVDKALETTIETVDHAVVLRLQSIEERARRGLEIVRSHVVALRGRQRALRSDAGAAGQQLTEAELRRESLEPELGALRESQSALAVESAELRVRSEACAEGLRRDVDAGEKLAMAAPRPEIPDGTEPDAHLETLWNVLRGLGPVNPLAAAEYQELAERTAFMEEQLEDLSSSRRELTKVIAALDAEISTLFRGAFEEIAERFAENFTLLFPGGTGRLTLTDPDKPLETGVDIHAQPLGKKVGRLQLLSGGERSLAALAFLFAVFRARPSPFYVLDEVEAALDDANLRRFLRLVGTLRDASQLVIVTHQQQTMEAGDLLYGVTMEPGGSSQVLAKHLAKV